MKRITLALTLCLAASSAQAGFLERSKHAAKALPYSAVVLYNCWQTYTILVGCKNPKKSTYNKLINLYNLGLIILTSKWAAEKALPEWKKAFSSNEPNKEDTNDETTK